MSGKETREVSGSHSGRFEAVVLAPMRATQDILSNMNNATLSAIGGVEHLEEKAETARDRQAEKTAQKPGKRLEKKPSIRRNLAQKKMEVVARPDPMPGKERKPQEAAL